MLVSDTKRFVFIHNPKCAGTSVRDMLMAFETTGNKFWGVLQMPDRQIDRAHVPLDNMRALYPEIYKLLPQYFSFAFVRDPYERVVSAYDYVEGRYVVNTPSYARQMNAYLQGNLHALVTDLSPASIHFTPQHRFLFDGAERKVEHVFRYETLERDVRLLHHRLGLPLAPEASLLRTNRARPRRATSALLDAATIRKVNDHYARDFDSFGYSRRPEF